MVSVRTEKERVMGMREKLIEKLTSFYGVDPIYFGVEAQALADHLIANGVEIPVHCCDCARCITHIDEVGRPWLFCERQNGRPVDPTDFCSYGEAIPYSATTNVPERREGE